MIHAIRWQQRFSNYKKALQQLGEAIALSNTRELSDLEKQGLIQAFEYTHELAWSNDALLRVVYQFGRKAGGATSGC